MIKDIRRPSMQYPTKAAPMPSGRTAAVVRVNGGNSFSQVLHRKSGGGPAASAPLSEDREDLPLSVSFQGAVITDLLYNLHRKSTKLIDTHVICQDGYIPVHRCVLMAASKLLRPILAEEDPAEFASVSLPDYTVRQVLPVINSFYTGSTLFKQDALNATLELIQLLQADHGTTYTFQPAKPGDEDLEPKMRHYATTRSRSTSRTKSRSSERTPRLDQICGNYAVDEESLFGSSEPNSRAASPLPDSLVFEPEDHLEDELEDSQEGADDHEEVGDVEESNDSVDYNAISEMNILGVDIEEVDGEHGIERQTRNILSSLEIPADEFDPVMAAITVNSSKTVMYCGEDSAGSTSLHSGFEDADDFDDSFEINLVSNVLVRPDVLTEHLNKVSSMEEGEDDLMSSASSPAELETVFAQEPTSEKPPRVINGRHYTEIQTTTFDEFGERPQIAQIITEPSGPRSEGRPKKARPKSPMGSIKVNDDVVTQQGFKVPTAPTKKSAAKIPEMPTFHFARIGANSESKAAEKQKRHEDLLFSMQLQENLLKGLAAIETDDSAVETDLEDEARSPNKTSSNSPQKQMTPACTVNLTGSKQNKVPIQKDERPRTRKTATPSSATSASRKSNKSATIEKSKKKSSSEVLALVEACNLVGGFLGPSSTRSSRSTSREAHSSSPLHTVAQSSLQNSRTSSFESDLSQMVEEPQNPLSDDRVQRRLSQASVLSQSDPQDTPDPPMSNLISSRRVSSSSTSSTASSKSSAELRTRSKSRESLENPSTPKSRRSRRNSVSSADVTASSPFRSDEASAKNVAEAPRISSEESNDLITPSVATVTSNVCKVTSEARPTLTKGALKQVTVVESVRRKRSQSQEDNEPAVVAKRPTMDEEEVVEIIGESAVQLEVVHETQEQETSATVELVSPLVNINCAKTSEVATQNAEPPSVEPFSEPAKETTAPAAEPCVAEEAEIRTAIAKQLQESVKRLEDLAAKDYFSDPEASSPPRILEKDSTAPQSTFAAAIVAIVAQKSLSSEVSNDNRLMEAAEESSGPESFSGNKSAEEDYQTEEELNRQIELNMQRLGSAAPILPINIEQRTPKSTKFFEEFVKKKFEKLQATEEHKKDDTGEQPAVTDDDDHETVQNKTTANNDDIVEEDFDDGAPGTTIIEGYEIVDYIPDAENEIVVENEVSVGEEQMMDEYKMRSSPPPAVVLPQQSRPGLIPDIESSGSILRLKLNHSPAVQTNNNIVEVESLYSEPEEEEDAAEGSVSLSTIANALEAYPTRAFQTEHDGLTYVIRNPTVVCNRLSTEKVKEKLQKLKNTARPESPPPPLLTKAMNLTPSPPTNFGKSPPTLTISISGNSAFIKNRQSSSGQSSPPKLDVYGHEPHRQEFKNKFSRSNQPKQKSTRPQPSASLSISPASFGNYPAVAKAPVQPPSITGNDIEWYRKQLKQCPHCGKKYKSHKNATYCLGLHGYRRCIICLDLLKNHDTSYEQHLAKYHEDEGSKGLVNCPICSQLYHVTGLITHVDRKHLRTPPNAESIPLPLTSPPLWTVKKDKNTKPRTYNNNNNSKRPKPPLPNLYDSYRPPYAEQHYQVYQQKEQQHRKQPQAQKAFLLKSSSVYKSKGPMLSDDEDEENNPKSFSGYMTEAQRMQFAFKLFKPYDATKDLEAVIDQNIVTLATAKKAFGIEEVEEQVEVEEIPEEQSYGVYDRIREERAEVVAEIAHLESVAASSNVNVDFDTSTNSNSTANSEKPAEFVQPHYPTYSDMTLNYTQEWPQCSHADQQSYTQQQVASCNNNYYHSASFNQESFDQRQYDTEPAVYEQQQNTAGQPQPYNSGYDGNDKRYTEAPGEPVNTAQQGRTLEEQIADQDFDTPIPEDLSNTTATEEIVETVIEPEQVRLNIVDPPYSDQQIADAVSTIQPTSPEAPSSPQGPTPAQDFPLDDLNLQEQPSDLSVHGQHSADRDRSQQSESPSVKPASSSTRLPDMPEILDATAPETNSQPHSEYLLGSVTVSVTRQRNGSVDSLVTSSSTTTTTNVSENSSKSSDDRIPSPSKLTGQSSSNKVRSPSPSPTDLVVTTSPPTLQSLLGDDKSSDSYATATLIYEPVTPTPEDLTESRNSQQRSSSGAAAPSQQPVITTTAAAMSAPVPDEFDISRYISTSIVPAQPPATVSTAEASVITSHQSKRHHHHQIADIIQQPKKRYIQQFTDVPDYQAYLNQASAASAYGQMHNLGNMHFGTHSSASSFSSRHTPMNLHQSAAHHYDVLPHHHNTGYTSSTHSHHRSSGSSSSHHHHQHHGSSNNPYNLSSSAAASYHSQHLQISPYSSSASHYRHHSGSSGGYHGRGDKMSSASHHNSSNIHVDESGSLLCELTPVRSSYSNSLRYLATTSSALKAVGASSSAYDVSSATAIDASTRPSLFATPPLSSLHHQEAAAALLSNPIGYTTYNPNPEDSYRRSVSSSSSHSSNSATTSSSSSSGSSHSSMAQHHDIAHLSATWGTTIRTVDSNQTVRPFDYGEDLDGHGSKASIQCERCRQHFHLAAFNDHKCNY